MSQTNAARTPYALISIGLALLSAACAQDSAPAAPDAAVILARDRAADHGQREEWAKAREVLAPVVAAKGAAAEDLLRAACAELANDSENERVARALPLLERAQQAGAAADVLAWCRYRVAAVEYDNEKALPLLRALHAERPQDFVVTLTLAATLDDLDQPALESEAQALFGELLALPAETTGAWRSTMLFRLANSLQRQGKAEEAKPRYDEFNALDERGVKNPGTPAHQPGTLGEIHPHTPGLFEPAAPLTPAAAFEARALEGPGLAGVFVVQPSYAGAQGQLSRLAVYIAIAVGLGTGRIGQRRGKCVACPRILQSSRRRGRRTRGDQQRRQSDSTGPWPSSPRSSPARV